MAQPTDETSLLASGDVVLDRYRVVEQIAAGGHSLVFRGEDTRLARPVCIKVFSGLGGKSGVGRTTYEHFVQEAFALSRLTHPNTLRIYDFGHLDANKRLDTGAKPERTRNAEPPDARPVSGRPGPDDDLGLPLQVCEYMNGGTLSTLLREKGPQSIIETMRIIGAMCEALAEAHNLGIVHRDIKPQNILFASVGDSKLPKLADFGIAKWSADPEAQSSKRADDTQIVAGQKLAMYSPSWAAPEQLAGQPVGAGTDIYSLAALAIYMLTGKAIFSDEDVYAGYKKRRQWDSLVRDALLPLPLPQSFVAVLSRALAFDPKDRTNKISTFSAEMNQSLVPPAPAPVLAAVPSIDSFDEPSARHRSGSAQHPSGAASGAAAGAPAAVASPYPSVSSHSGAIASLSSSMSSPPPSSTPATSMPALSADYQQLPPPQQLPTYSEVVGSTSPETHADPSSRQGDPLDRLADGTKYRVYGGLPSGPATSSSYPPPPHTPVYTPPPAPLARQAWFGNPIAPSSAVRRIAPSEMPVIIGERRLHFVLTPSGIVDLVGPEGSRVRMTILPAPDGRRIIHIKSLSCFVAHHGGRPSPAIHCDRDADVELVTPRAQPLAFARLTIGHPGHAETPFLIGSERITVRREDLADPILFDFGPGSEAYLIYTQGRTAPQKIPRRGQ